MNVIKIHRRKLAFEKTESHTTFFICLSTSTMRIIQAYAFCDPTMVYPPSFHAYKTCILQKIIAKRIVTHIPASTYLTFDDSRVEIIYRWKIDWKSWESYSIEA